jgi:hypothetical protein
MSGSLGSLHAYFQTYVRPLTSHGVPRQAYFHPGLHHQINGVHSEPPEWTLLGKPHICSQFLWSSYAHCLMSCSLLLADRMVRSAFPTNAQWPWEEVYFLRWMSAADFAT